MEVSGGNDHTAASPRLELRKKPLLPCWNTQPRCAVESLLSLLFPLVPKQSVGGVQKFENTEAFLQRPVEMVTEPDPGDHPSET